MCDTVNHAKKEFECVMCGSDTCPQERKKEIEAAAAVAAEIEAAVAAVEGSYEARRKIQQGAAAEGHGEEVADGVGGGGGGGGGGAPPPPGLAALELRNDSAIAKAEATATLDAMGFTRVEVDEASKRSSSLEAMLEYIARRREGEGGGEF